MFVLSKTPSEAGQYPPIMQSAQAAIPEGYYWWPDSLEQDTFLQYEGFILPIIKRGTVASYTANVEAYEAWKASQPGPDPGPDMSGYATWDELAAAWREELPAQWRFAWSTDPKKALPFIELATSPYSTGDCCTYDGHVWRSGQDTNTWAPGTVGVKWDDLGTIEEVQG